MNHSRGRVRDRKFFFYFIPLLLLIFLPLDKALADKAAVALESPAVAAKGEEATLLLTVTHSADNFFHHVNWVVVLVNGQAAFRWEYSPFDLPPAATFKKEIKAKIEGDTEINAEANCNIHGSKGPASMKIVAKE